jgi:hypothetical protein
MKLLLILPLLALCGHLNAQSLTVTTPVWKTTNAISAVRHTPDCTLVVYVENGKTNEFHAWLVPVTIETNKPRAVYGSTNVQFATNATIYRSNLSASSFVMATNLTNVVIAAPTLTRKDLLKILFGK